MPLDIIEDKFKTTYVDTLEQELTTFGEEYSKDLIDSASPDDKFKGELTENEVNNDYIFDLKSQIGDEIKNQSIELINTIKKMGYKMENIKMDYDVVIDNICIEMLLEDDLSSFLKDLALENMDYDYSDMERINTITVDDIFNQEYDIDD